MIVVDKSQSACHILCNRYSEVMKDPLVNSKVPSGTLSVEFTVDVIIVNTNKIDSSCFTPRLRDIIIL